MGQGLPSNVSTPAETERHENGDRQEETHFTIAYSPVPDQTVPSGIGGVLATVHEITEKVVGQRRILALRDLGAQVLSLIDPFTIVVLRLI